MLPELNRITRKIWQWCENRGLWIFASYVPSVSNIADEGSRFLPADCEWELADYAFHQIINKFGCPDIDCVSNKHQM